MQHRVFILSTGRTGTKFLARYFQANFDGVWAVHEPPPAAFRLVSNAYVAGAISLAALKRLVRVARRRMLSGKTTSHPIYLESNNFIYGFFEVLAELEPPPTIVHVVRDPRTYVRSIIRHGNLQGGKLLASKLVPFWYASVRQQVGPLHTAIGRFAGQWLIVNRFLLEQGSRYEHYHRLRFEDIFDGAESGLQALCDILGLPYPGPQARLTTGQKVNGGRQADIGPWQCWPPGWVEELHRICTPLMQEAGYGSEADGLAQAACDSIAVPATLSLPGEAAGQFLDLL